MTHIALSPVRSNRVGLLLCILTGACDQPKGSESSATTDSAGVTIVTNDLSQLTAVCAVGTEPQVTIGSVDREQYELHRVSGATRLTDGRIVLVNRGTQQLRFYDRAGRYQMSAGRGPGEFSNAFYIWVMRGDTIWAGDYPPWQFLVFRPDGQWVKTVRPRPEYVDMPNVILVHDDGRSVLGTGTRSLNSHFERRPITVAVHGAKGELIDTIGTYPDRRLGKIDLPGSPIIDPLFESFAQIVAAGSRVVVAHTSEPRVSILTIASQLRTDRIIRWTTESRTVSSGHIQAERKRIAALYEDLDPATRRRWVEPMVTEKRPVADRFPAFASLMAGRDGRIWIRNYPRPQDTQTQRWLAFSRVGCRATLPELDQILEFGADYFLALDRDDLGVERVVQYSLASPRAGGGNP